MSNKLKGKKIDHEFVATFIEKCISEDKKSSLDIINEANKKIKKIEKKIAQINKLKLEYCNLLSVIGSFEQQDK